MQRAFPQASPSTSPCLSQASRFPPPLSPPVPQEHPIPRLPPPRAVLRHTVGQSPDFRQDLHLLPPLLPQSFPGSPTMSEPSASLLQFPIPNPHRRLCR